MEAPEVIPVEFDDVVAAAARIKDHVYRTPLLPAPGLGGDTSLDLWLKAENLQRGGAFKVRGAINAVSLLSRDRLRHGVVTLSAGNHGIALSYAASVAGCPATIVMPDTAVRAKIAAIEAFGGRPVLVDGATLLEHTRKLQEALGATFVHPFDDPDVIAGQGTVGLEIMDEAPSLDMVVVPVGGGGLISGVATAVKGRSPQTMVVGVEPEGSAAVARSLAAGRPVNLESFSTVADGLNAPFGAPNSLSIVQNRVDEMVTVSDGEIVEALGIILDRGRLLVEPAGAAAVAALLSSKIPQAGGKRVAAILSGGNVDRDKLLRLLACSPL